MKPAEILIKVRAQFSDKMLSRTQVCDWSKSFKEHCTEVKTTPTAGKVMANVSWGIHSALFIDFLTEQ
jgi:hypothetical protein